MKQLEPSSKPGEKAEEKPPPKARRDLAGDRPEASKSSVLDLQRAIGNQAVLSLLKSGAIQAKLQVSQPGDPDEVEADRVAAAVTASPTETGIHRKCACKGGDSCPECEEEAEQAKKVRRKPSPGSVGGEEFDENLLSSLGPGRPLEPSVRSSMEPPFGRDFGDVRVHTDAQAGEAAEKINAVAFTRGDHIFFGHGNYAPENEAGRGILAHELTHVVQQRGGRSPGERSNRGPAPLIMRLTPTEFQQQLGATADQKAAIAALFSNATFLALCHYLKKCTLAKQQDLGPLALKVSPGLKIGGVERYGGYFPGTRTLEINPTKAEHKANPAELVDTIVHELIHAVDDLKDDCKKAGAGDALLAGAATATAPSRASVAGTPKEQQLMQDQGPGLSNPCEEFVDLNKAAQQMVIQIIRENIQVAKVGRPTVVFVNEILRQDPKAMKAYIACRDAACAKAKPEDRQKEIAACSADIIAHYMPKSLAP